MYHNGAAKGGAVSILATHIRVRLYIYEIEIALDISRAGKEMSVYKARGRYSV